MSDTDKLQTPSQRKRKRWLVRAAVFLLVTLSFDQGLQHLALGDGFFMGRRVAPFDPPIFHGGQQKVLNTLTRFVETGKPRERSFHMDPDLGWCALEGDTWGNKHFDWAACRKSSAPLDREGGQGLKRILTLGCSFTLGEEVDDNETWPYMLDERHGEVEFGNLAMSAYGIDQALLRYRRDGRALEGDEIWLGVLPEACLRVASVYRPAQRHWASSVVFKPRFELGTKGELQLIPCPSGGPRETHRLISSQQDFYNATREHDAWVKRVPLAYAPMGSSLLHHSGLSRLALTLMDSRERNPTASLADSESEVYQLMRSICLQFAKEVKSDGARFRLILLPSRGGMQRFQAGESGMADLLMDDLRSRGIEVIDCSEAGLAANMGARQEYWAAGGHYSALGNKVIADYLESLL